MIHAFEAVVCFGFLTLGVFVAFRWLIEEL